MIFEHVAVLAGRDLGHSSLLQVQYVRDDGPCVPRLDATAMQLRKIMRFDVGFLDLGPSITDPMGVVKGLHVSVEELQASIQSIPGQDIALPLSRHMVPQNIGYDVAGHTMMVQHVEKVEPVCLPVEEGMADQWVQWVSQGSKVCLMQQAFQELHTSCRHQAGHWCSDSWACLDQMAAMCCPCASARAEVGHGYMVFMKDKRRVS